MALLLSSTVVAQEQERPVMLRRHEGTTWSRMLTDGGMVRRGDRFVAMLDGLSDFMSMNYVDGYLWGPSDVTVGRIFADYSRLEVTPMVRYADARHAWMASGRVRYVLAPRLHSWLEAFGGRYTDDIDESAPMDEAWRGMASGLFGWNGYRLYERTMAGLRTSVAVASDFQLDGRLSYEGRRPMTNHRQRNVFRVCGDANVPTSTDVRMARADVALSFTPGRRILVVDDMTAVAQSAWPTTTLAARVGRRFLSLEASASQTVPVHRGVAGAVAWQAAAGFFPSSLRPTDIVDAHHLDASRFWWQRSHRLTHFALLRNYELSTRHAWGEGHVEWTSAHLLTWRTAAGAAFGESVGFHAAWVAHAPLHTEAAYAVELAQSMRLGLTVGLDGARWDGVAFTLVMNLKARSAVHPL